jgi:hypothetical protein
MKVRAARYCFCITRQVSAWKKVRGYVRRELLSESATATDQSHKLARLLLRLPGVAVLDHNASIVAGKGLKRAGREGYGRCALSMFAKPLFESRANVAALTQHRHPIHSTGHELPTLRTSSKEALIIIRVGPARQPRTYGYS